MFPKSTLKEGPKAAGSVHDIKLEVTEKTLIYNNSLEYSLFKLIKGQILIKILLDWTIRSVDLQTLLISRKKTQHKFVKF